MPQVSFSLEGFAIDLLKKDSKKNKESLSEYLRQQTLEHLLKSCPNLVAFRNPLTGKIIQILNEKESKAFRESMREAESDLTHGNVHSVENIDNFWQEINSGD